MSLDILPASLESIRREFDDISTGALEQDAELYLKPEELPADLIDFRDVFNAAREALGMDTEADWMTKRRRVRSALLNIHGVMDPSLNSTGTTSPNFAHERLELFSLLAQLHTKYADLMTRNGFSQYGDVSHASDAGIKGTSRRELAERYFAIQLAEHLMAAGMPAELLQKCTNHNYWILRERLADDAWESQEGQARIKAVETEATEFVEMYLPERSHTVRASIGLNALRQTPIAA